MRDVVVGLSDCVLRLGSLLLRISPHNYTPLLRPLSGVQLLATENPLREPEQVCVELAGRQFGPGPILA